MDGREDSPVSAHVRPIRPAPCRKREFIPVTPRVSGELEAGISSRDRTSVQCRWQLWIGCDLASDALHFLVPSTPFCGINSKDCLK
jgi:hypothetical protein